jgi:hypothetical protein
MAITLAADALSDAEITDGIALGDLGCAARLWVRLWPTSLNAARDLVGPGEVPGLAAEALIGTIAAIAIGRGPREDVKPFLRGAVRELGDHGGPPPPGYAGAWSPDVSTSPIMSGAFARLPDLVQDLLWITVVGDRADEIIADALGISTTAAATVRIDALTTLQRDHLAAHADRVADPACHRAHHALALAVEDPGAAGLSRETWMHLSACAWCTTAFHELVFSNAAIGALVDRAATPSPVVPPVVPPVVAPDVGAPEVEVEVAGGLDEPARANPPDEPPPRGRLHADVASSPPGFVRRHGRVLAGAVVVVAGAAVVALVVAGIGSDRSAPPEAAGPPTVTPTPAAGSALHGASPSTSDATEAVGSTPGTVVGDLPSTTVTPRAPKSRTVAPSSPSATPTPQPSATTPSVEPPAASTPTPTPTPTPPPPPPPPPTPTPTPEPCSALAHLLGLC